MIEELIKRRGFDDFGEYVYLINLLKQTVSSNIFDHWKLSKGTKTDLLFLLDKVTIH